jgi:hypothetical protein
LRMTLDRGRLESSQRTSSFSGTHSRKCPSPARNEEIPLSNRASLKYREEWQNRAKQGKNWPKLATFGKTLEGLKFTLKC